MQGEPCKGSELRSGTNEQIILEAGLRSRGLCRGGSGQEDRICAGGEAS